MSYPRLIASMLALLFAGVNIFWSALAAARAGPWADRGHAQRTSAAVLVVLLLAWWPLSLMQGSLGRWWPASCCATWAARRCTSPIRA